MDDFIVGRKAIIEFLRAALDLSPTAKTAWNKILRWRKDQGMEKIFHRDITGRPYIIPEEARRWFLEAEGKARRVPRGFEIQSSKKRVAEKSANSQ